MKLLHEIKGIAAFTLAAMAGLFATGASAAADPQASGSVVAEVVEVEPVEPLDAEELEALVAPVALYPDDLLAVVLPASTYPLQIVLAARFIESGQENADGEALQPSEEWDDAVVALLNYPEVVALMDGDLDWTRRLGEAVILQEEDVIAAISAFREQAKKAGNLESDGKQDVAVNESGAIEIKPAVPDEIYVPYYEPAEVVVRQPVRVYHYYPRPYPVYYYPYHQGYNFAYGPFWGVTSAFSIGWHTRNLHLHHYGFNDHPYYSYRYHDPFYYRRPHLVLNVYDRDRRHRHRHRSERHHRGNDWRSERSKRDHRQWANRGEGRRGELRAENRRGKIARNEERRGERPGHHRTQAALAERPRGEGRGRGDGQRQRANQSEGQRLAIGQQDRRGKIVRSAGQRGASIARTLETGTNPAIPKPNRATPTGETPRRPTPNRARAGGRPAAGVASTNPVDEQRAQPQARSPSWRAERRSENARSPQSRSQGARQATNRPAQQANRAQPARRVQRQAQPNRSAATQPRRAAAPAQARPTQRADRAPRQVQRTPPRAQRPQTTSRPNARQAIQQARSQPRSQPRSQSRSSVNRAPPTRVQRSSGAARQAVQRSAPQTRAQPRINNRASSARNDQPARAAANARTERSAPQRPVRAHPGRSNDNVRSRQPR